MVGDFDQRLPFSAIVDRPVWYLPDGARMVVWPIVNVEHWSINGQMPRSVLSPPMGLPREPDIANWTWHEYGMRVGFWRIFAALDSRNIVPTLAINGSVCERYPRVAGAAREAGWEFMGHGHVQAPMHALVDQRDAIRQAIAAICKFTGKPPRGWESPGLTETFETLDILREEGIEYVADWVMDDQPCDLFTTAGTIVALPYTVELNDVVMMAIQHHSSFEWLERGIRQFDRLYAESEAGMRVMAVSVHPYLSGVPHRIGYVEALFDHLRSKPGVLFWTGERILDWHLANRGN